MTSAPTVSLPEVVTATFGDAIAMAQEDAMREDPRIVLLGQDIQAGFPFGATKGLVDIFGEGRVINTPISEAGTMGCGVGAALGGLKPVVEVDFAGFLLQGLDQLINNGAKLRYMSGNQISVPLVVRIGQGPLGSFAAQHSQTQHAYLSGVPGLTTLTPATPQGVYWALRWGLAQDHTVVVFEDMRLYRRSGQLTRSMPTADLSSTVHRSGGDASVIAFGHGVLLALEAAETLSASGVSVEVLGLESLNPIDSAAIAATARRTGRVLCVSDDPVLFGAAAAIALIANTEAFGDLICPATVLGAKHVPAPYAPELESLVFPTADAVAKALERLLEWED